MNRHTCETVARPGDDRKRMRDDNGHSSIQQPPPADKALARYILDHHLARLRDGFALAVVRSLAMCREPLSSRQVEVLASIWVRLQGAR